MGSRYISAFFFLSVVQRLPVPTFSPSPLPSHAFSRLYSISR